MNDLGPVFFRQISGTPCAGSDHSNVADTRTSAGGLPELEGAENTAGWTDVDGSAVAAGNHESATVLAAMATSSCTRLLARSGDGVK